MGLKLIPPGAHFIHYSLKEENYMQKQGFWIHIGEGKDNIIVKTFSEDLKQFTQLETE